MKCLKIELAEKPVLYVPCFNVFDTFNWLAQLIVDEKFSACYISVVEL